VAQSCQYEGCKAPAEAGSEFCTFHSTSPKDLEKFKSALSGQLSEVGLTEDRNGRYSFDGYVFPTTIAASGSPIDNRILLPQTIEGNASFGGAKVKGDASFSGAKIKGARKVIMNITGGNDLTLEEVTEAASLIREAVSDRADIIFGTAIRDGMETVRLTVIATGFAVVRPGEEEEGSVLGNETMLEQLPSLFHLPFHR